MQRRWRTHWSVFLDSLFPLITNAFFLIYPVGYDQYKVFLNFLSPQAKSENNDIRRVQKKYCTTRGRFN
jgi:hypothetical protein